MSDHLPPFPLGYAFRFYHIYSEVKKGENKKSRTLLIMFLELIETMEMKYL